MSNIQACATERGTASPARGGKFNVNWEHRKSLISDVPASFVLEKLKIETGKLKVFKQ